MRGERVVLTYKDYETLPADGRRYELHARAGASKDVRHFPGGGIGGGPCPSSESISAGVKKSPPSDRAAGPAALGFLRTL